MILFKQFTKGKVFFTAVNSLLLLSVLSNKMLFQTNSSILSLQSLSNKQVLTVVNNKIVWVFFNLTDSCVSNKKKRNNDDRYFAIKLLEIYLHNIGK